jgi:radical SAM superfamily enzyme YgiQ (UPF0313 family)
MALEKWRGNEVRLFDTTKYNFGIIDSNTWGIKTGTFKPVSIPQHTKVADTSAKDFRDTLEDFRPDEVWVSLMSDEVDVARRLTAIALNFGSVVRWGGVHPTVAPKDHPQGVAVHRGEAFESIYAIKSLNDLPYVSWDEYEEAQFLRPYEGKVYRAGDHVVNWGCPYACSYCINSGIKSKLQRYDTARIIEELKYLKKKYGITFLKFHDEDFLNRSVSGLRELARVYADEVGIPYVTETNPHTVTEEKAQLMKDMGCVSVSMGLETGNPDLRKNLLNRSDSIDDVIRAFHIFNKVGIRTSSFNMIGIPFETRATYQETIELNKRAEVRAPYIHFFYPFSGTPLRTVAIKHGFFNPETAPPYSRERSSMTFPDLSGDDLAIMKNTFVERIHAAV